MIRPSVIYREELTVDDYNEAIAALEDARGQLRPDGHNCAICHDSGHQAFECHHNPLLVARQWARATSVYQCWHCGYVATNDAEAAAHFGKTDEEVAKCVGAPPSPEMLAELKEWRRLRDPSILHANLLRGIPASLSRAQFAHLLGTNEGGPPRAATQGRSDTERFNWYFGNSDKGQFMNTYLQGMREGWSIDQWRPAIDAHMPENGSHD